MITFTRRLISNNLPLKSWALVVISLGTLSPTAIAKNNQLRVRLVADIRSTDPGVNRDANTDAVVLHMVEGLVGIRENTAIGPMLAEKIATSSDGKTYDFKLREGIIFHNGEPLTAEDVVWTWKRYLNPSSQWRCLSEFDGRGVATIIGVEAIDKRTVSFKLDKPNALFLTQMARPDCGASGIYHRSSIGTDGKWKEPVGTGPFRFAEWRRGQYIELQKFEGYRSRPGLMDGLIGAKKAEVDRVRFMVIPDSAAAKAALLSNSLELVPDIAVSELGDLNGQSAVKIEKVTTAALSGLLLQTRDPLLKDVRIRQAIALGIDSQTIVRGITNALAKVNNSAVPETSPFYSAIQKTGFQTDVVKAKKLLQEAGYNGQVIKLTTNKRYHSMFDMALLTQSLAAKVGINIELEVLDWATQLDRYSKGDYQIMAFGYSARLDPSLAFEMFTGPKDMQPRKTWDNPEAIRLVEVSMQTSDLKRRQELFNALHKQLLEDVPMIALYNAIQINAISSRLNGFHGWSGETPRLWNVQFR